MNLALQIALRHLKSPRRGSFSSFASLLATLGLGLGVTALVLTVCILEGFERTLASKIAEFDGHIRIQHFLNRTFPADDQEVSGILADLSQTYPLRSTAFLQQAALLRVGQRAEGVLVEGLQPGREIIPLDKILVAGSSQLEPGTVIIGSGLAANLGLNLGDKLVLFDLHSIADLTDQGRVGSYRIGGLFHSGLLEYDRSLVYMPLAAAGELFGFEEQVNGHILRLEDDRQAEAVLDTLNSRLSYPYYVLSWKEKHRLLFQWLKIQKWPISIIFGLIAMVGLVNIVSALAMMVIEKIHQIGILLAIGLSRRRIQRIFIIKGVVIGTLGTLVGMVLALLLAGIQTRFHLLSIPETVYFMDQVPLALNAPAVTVIALAAVLGSVLAALWPTYKAARIQPARALRYE